MITPNFRGIFRQARECFGGTLENLLKNIFYFILLNHGVSGGGSIQMPFFEAFNCSIRR